MSTAKIRVLITDDSVLARAIIRDILESDPLIEIIGEAENGMEAVQKVESLKPDIVTMDIQMPVMNGHEAIEQIMSQHALPILVVSSLDDAENACACISRGALETIGKPQLESLQAAQFIKKVKMLASVKVITHIKNRSPSNHQSSALKQNEPQNSEIFFNKNTIFTIASSTGGPQALEIILKDLPASFPAPIVIAQHISPGFEQGLADWLNHELALQVKLGEHGETIKPGIIYISPASQHMTLSLSHTIQLVDKKSGDIYSPSCDLLLESVAAAYRRHAVGIICTGMGKDGAKGMQAIKQQGGTTIAQDEQTSVIFGMNQKAIESGAIQHILPLNQISLKMKTLCG